MKNRGGQSLTCWLLLLSSSLFIIEEIIVLAPLTG
jgi:hypothetical protein